MKLSIVRDISKRFPPPTTQEQAQKNLDTLCTEDVDFEDFYQELEMSDPFVETHRDVSYSNSQLNLHSHTFYELLYCCNDCGAEYLLGASRYRLQKGDIIFVPPGISHRPLLPESMTEPYERYVLWISQEFVDRFSQMFAVGEKMMAYGTLLRTGNNKWEMLSGYFRRGVWEAEHRAPGWQAAIVGNTITLLTLMSRSIQERTADLLKAEKPDLLNKVMNYIELHLNEKITLEETAKHFFVSVSTITQLFRHKMGTSFYRCVTQRRLIAAKVRMGDGEALEDVSRAVGFADYSSFYRAFKKEYGITPRQYTQL